MKVEMYNNANAVFDITASPFLKEIILIYHVPTGEKVVWEYVELDEWYGHKFGGVDYDFHLMFDETGLEFHIYKYGDYSLPVPHNLNLDF